MIVDETAIQKRENNKLLQVILRPKKDTYEQHKASCKRSPKRDDIQRVQNQNKVVNKPGCLKLRHQ